MSRSLGPKVNEPKFSPLAGAVSATDGPNDNETLSNTASLVSAL